MLPSTVSAALEQMLVRNQPVCYLRMSFAAVSVNIVEFGLDAAYAQADPY